jgi:hypothetical protein
MPCAAFRVWRPNCRRRTRAAPQARIEEGQNGFVYPVVVKRHRRSLRVFQQTRVTRPPDRDIVRVPSRPTSTAEEA